MSTSDKLPIKPLNGRILAVRYTKEIGEGFDQGIIIPLDNKIKSQEVEIVSLGKPINSISGVSVGDKVLINKYSGIEIKVLGTTFLLLKEEDLLVKLI